MADMFCCSSSGVRALVSVSTAVNPVSSPGSTPGRAEAVSYTHLVIDSDKQEQLGGMSGKYLMQAVIDTHHFITDDARCV